MRDEIMIKAWVWQRVLSITLAWCRWCRWWHTRADNLCGWAVRKVEHESHEGPRKDTKGEPVGPPLQEV